MASKSVFRTSLRAQPAAQVQRGAMGRRAEKAKEAAELPPVKDPATESRRRRGKTNKVADDSGGGAQPESGAVPDPQAAPPPAEGTPAAAGEISGEVSAGGEATEVAAAAAGDVAANTNGAEGGVPIEEQEHWDLCLIVDASTKNRDEAEQVPYLPLHSLFRSWWRRGSSE